MSVEQHLRSVVASWAALPVAPLRAPGVHREVRAVGEPGELDLA